MFQKSQNFTNLEDINDAPQPYQERNFEISPRAKLQELIDLYEISELHLK